MSRGITLAPCGLSIEGIETDAENLLIMARSTASAASCPSCGSVSTKVHSKYQRFLSDLPSQGRAVRIRIQARRFRCIMTDCRQRIFRNGSRRPSPVHSPVGHRALRALFTTLVSHWVAGLGKASLAVCCCR
jgi:transposase